MVASSDSSSVVARGYLVEGVAGSREVGLPLG